MTVPAEAWRALSVKPGDKVAFTIEDGGVRVAPAPSVRNRTYGSVKPVEKPENFDAVSLTARKAKAEKTARAPNGA